MKEFTDANLTEALASGMPVVVDFWAPWCGPCKMMLPIMEELAAEYEGRILIGKMNVDENEDTPSDYGVMSIPTMIFFRNGEMVERHVGATTKADIQALLEKLL